MKAGDEMGPLQTLSLWVWNSSDLQPQVGIPTSTLQDKRYLPHFLSVAGFPASFCGELIKLIHSKEALNLSASVCLSQSPGIFLLQFVTVFSLLCGPAILLQVGEVWALASGVIWTRRIWAESCSILTPVGVQSVV